MSSYTCSTCRKTFSRLSSLRNHIKTHDNTAIDRILQEASEEIEEVNVRELVRLSDNNPIKTVLSYDEPSGGEELSYSVQQEVVVEDDVILEENEEGEKEEKEKEIVEEEEEEEIIEEEEEEEIIEEEVEEVSDHVKKYI